ncbi:protein arginine kinase [Candidatus Sumerlaeota bacterium]|nr:protein arginine kinase [Candidatus Sumerlaeota bacterium]
MIENVDLIELTQNWGEPAGPRNHVVVTSRVRHARNIERIAFPPRASKDDLRRVCETVDRLIRNNSALTDFKRVEIDACTGTQRGFLKESHIISAELEQGGEYRVLHLNQERSSAIMVNEEDHLRMYCMRSGFQLGPVLEQINAIDSVLSRSLNYAFSEKYGYLTTCPSNVGTGMRASAMLHLPGLVMTQQIEEIIKLLPQSGLTVRGYYGEHSEFLGDFYQVSNEVTLGKTEEQIIESLEGAVGQLMAQEEAAQAALFEKKRPYVEDVIWRAYGQLTNARIMSSAEAFRLLSPIRLGIGRGFFGALTHHDLNRLFVAVQPAHLQMAQTGAAGVEERDIARARFLQGVFGRLQSGN